MTALHTKVMEKTLTTSNPCHTGEKIQCPMPELSPQDEIEVFPEMLMVVLKTKQANESNET
ncbi:hypothetical protein UFOVP249_23 [uncultured Caudovirales phage]|uniref:Uncharacterized protein n=1 Tax=uncultured Caudovirales phage TaxID=2100421 RepID=A0A6J5LDW0_9CAUD|nr:hypothetical protein UFOVP249_23 [uncultured Caudovirales phage]